MKSIVPVSLLIALSAALVYGQAAATLTVSGDIPARLVLTAEDLAKMPRETVSMTEHEAKVDYEGVPLREILKRAGAPLEKELRGKALASYVIAKAHDNYQVVFTLPEVAPEFANEPIVVADKRDGKPLSGSLGPLRLICPKDKEGARSVRMLESLEFIRLQE